MSVILNKRTKAALTKAAVLVGVTANLIFRVAQHIEVKDKERVR